MEWSNIPPPQSEARASIEILLPSSVRHSVEGVPC